MKIPQKWFLVFWPIVCSESRWSRISQPECLCFNISGLNGALNSGCESKDLELGDVSKDLELGDVSKDLISKLALGLRNWAYHMLWVTLITNIETRVALLQWNWSKRSPAKSRTKASHLTSAPSVGLDRSASNDLKLAYRMLWVTLITNIATRMSMLQYKCLGLAA